MKLILERNIRAADGIFGHLLMENGTVLAFTLEHAYPTASTKSLVNVAVSPSLPLFSPKLPNGLFICELGSHRLHSMTKSFLTYEVMAVPGHTGILFHVGNSQADSEGCVLLGNSVIRTGTARVLAGSKLAFLRFLSELDGAETFQLEVREANDVR